MQFPTRIYFLLLAINFSPRALSNVPATLSSSAALPSITYQQLFDNFATIRLQHTPFANHHELIAHATTFLQTHTDTVASIKQFTYTLGALTAVFGAYALGAPWVQAPPLTSLEALFPAITTTLGCGVCSTSLLLNMRTAKKHAKILEWLKSFE